MNTEPSSSGPRNTAAKWSDISASVVLIGLALFVGYETTQFPQPIVPGSPGPALFPRVIASLLLTLAVILLFQGLKGTKGAGWHPHWQGLIRVGTSLASIIGFLLWVSRWGTYFLLPLLISWNMVVMGERRAQVIIVVPLLFDLFVYTVFHRIFGIAFPSVYF